MKKQSRDTKLQTEHKQF